MHTTNRNRVASESLESRLLFAAEYVVPFVELETTGPSETWNSVHLTAQQDNTQVDIDLDHNGSTDHTRIMNAGEQVTIGGAHHGGWTPTYSGLVPGTRIVSSAPLDAHYRFYMMNHSTYEDGEISYALPSPGLKGRSFTVPFAAAELGILATQMDTLIQIDTSGDGLPDRTFTLDAGQSRVELDLPVGAAIMSSADLYAVAVSQRDGYYDNTFASLLLPKHRWATQFALGAPHPDNYQSRDDQSRLLVVSSHDQTTITVNGTVYAADEGQVLTVPLTVAAVVETSSPSYAVFVSDVAGNDVWAGVRRNYTYSANAIPTSLFVHERLLTVGSASSHGGPNTRHTLTSLTDGNNVTLDIDDDGEVDQTITLARGASFVLDDNDNAFRNKQVRVESGHGLSIITSFRDWWNDISEHAAAYEHFANVAPPVANGIWDGGGDGVHWSDPNNWSNDTLPTATDDVIIDLIGTYPVLLEAAGATRVRSLTLGGGISGATPRLELRGGGDQVLVTGAISITGGARLDLNDDALIVDYIGASPLADIRESLASGYAGGGWNGSGIQSDAAATNPNASVGYAEASGLFHTFPGMFLGEAIDDTAALVAYTRYGDTDLNRSVNLADFNRLAANFGQANRHWYHGDFDFSGTVSLADFNRLAANFGQLLGTPAPGRGTWLGAGAWLGEMDDPDDDPLVR